MITQSPVRVAIVGDLHIGAPVRGLDATQSEHEAREFAYYATERLIETVAAAQIDAVLVTGDLFDRGDGSTRALRLAQRMVDEWCDAGRPLAMIGGNHDAESELPALLHLPGSARWFSAEQPETLALTDLGLAVHGVSVRERDDLREVIDSYPAPLAGEFNIAMLHSSLDGEWSNRPCLPVPLDRLRGDGRYEVWALGHVHRRLALGEGPIIAYPGGVHAKRENAEGARGFIVLEVDGPGAPGTRNAHLTEIDVQLETPVRAPETLAPRSTQGWSAKLHG